MAWAIHLTREAEKCLKKLPHNIIERSQDALKEIANNPHIGKPLKENLKGQFSLRLGDYRIVYILDSIHQQILILYIRHRKDAYR